MISLDRLQGRLLRSDSRVLYVLGDRLDDVRYVMGKRRSEAVHLARLRLTRQGWIRRYQIVVEPMNYLGWDGEKWEAQELWRIDVRPGSWIDNLLWDKPHRVTWLLRNSLTPAMEDHNFELWEGVVSVSRGPLLGNKKEGGGDGDDTPTGS